MTQVIRVTESNAIIKVSSGISQNAVNTSIATHAAATDPHGDRAFATSAASSAVGTHNTSATAHLNIAPGGATVSNQQLIEWCESGAYEMTAITYHGTNTKAVSTATVKWPDGSAGTFTTTAYNTTAFPARVNAYTVSHTASGKTVTQAACTLNADGEITTKPALTVA
jgi:hypothetical protein